MPVVIDGNPARILTELAEMGQPVPWEVVAREVWKAPMDLEPLRKIWDQTLRRLRLHLRQHGLREDLVRPDGHGNVEIFVMPGDRVSVSN